MASRSANVGFEGGAALASLLAHLAAAALGLLAGAMLLIALAVVPFWSALEPAAFALWFREYAPLLGRTMIPLGALAAVFALLAAAAARPVASPRFRWSAAAAALAVGVGALYPLYFGAANDAIAGGGLAPAEIAAELARWRTWHWVRTTAGVLGFLAALRALASAELPATSSRR
jgi:hypothetical protein